MNNSATENEGRDGTGGGAIPRCGFVALLGAPNAGKSTLTNAIVGTKISIVSPKVQTTRARITAIAMEGQSQIVLVDTPGIFEKTRKRLERAMVHAAWTGAADADLCALLIDAETGRERHSNTIIAGLKEAKRPSILILNKVDLVKKETLLGLASNLNAEGLFQDIFMISALKGDGVAALRSYLAKQLPVGPWLYPEDQLADITERLLAAEVTREKIFLKLHQELPYAITVETEEWKQQRNGSIRISQVIYVERDTQKAIVLGKGGAQIKQLGQLAREELKEILGVDVHLFLFVKVRSNWSDDPERYREMGLEYVK